ncbi:hypothetical protein G6M04_14645 [Agrobacterium rhizogenes]|uniref:hypothetical protein n=1 Tax=Rhizobium rhizogenes TaxID=359 RepID=UPI001571CFA0|nr:hypothetical protein [Rhizobium rhizogenes]NTG48629.1 hypothetical protein [Rhizobium rhizogenes]
MNAAKELSDQITKGAFEAPSRFYVRWATGPEGDLRIRKWSQFPFEGSEDYSLVAADSRIAELEQQIANIKASRDLQVTIAADEEERARKAEDNLSEAVKVINEARAALDGELEYHHSGMGCGLEDRNIHDRYDAMHHGWECALERSYGEHIIPAREAIDAFLSKLEGSSHAKA